MHETITCPACQSHLVLPPVPLGQTVQCPRCQHVFEPASPYAKSIARPASPERYSDDELSDPTLARVMRPQPLVGEWKATIAMIALAASVLTFMLSIYVGYERIDLIETQMKLEEGRGRQPFLRLARDIQAQGRLDDFRSRIDRWERIAYLTSIVEQLTYWPAVLFFLIWMYQATATARIVEPEFFTHTPGKAVASFFIPIMNLFWPHTIIHDIWRASDPLPVSAVQTWTKVRGSLLIRAWWLCWLLHMPLAFISSRMADPADDFLPRNPPLFVASPHDQVAATTLACAASVCVILAGGMLMFIIRAIAVRQRERYVRLYEDPA